MPFFCSLPQLSPLDVQRKTVQVDERLTVQAWHYSASKDGRLEFDKDVESKYGVTTVKSDRLRAFLSPPEAKSEFLVRRAIAEGNVSLVDPDGTIQADRIEFDWVTGLGTATMAKIDVAGLEIEADSMDIKPKEWTMANVRIRACQGGDVSFRMRSLRMIPGDRLVADRLKANLLGLGLSLPRYSVALQIQGDVTTIPKVSYGSDKGLAASWNVVYRLNPVEILKSRFAVAEQSAPSVSLRATHSFLGPDEPVLPPRSVTGRGFSSSFMNNITVESPADERDRISRKRLSLSIGTAWNLEDFEETDRKFDRPFDIVVEGGRAFGHWGVYGQLRHEQIAVQGEPREQRSVGALTVLAPAAKFSKSLEGYLRFDSRGILNAGGREHAWIRGEAGIAWQAMDFLRFAASHGDGVITGQRRYIFDEPRAMRSTNFRLDYDRGPTAIGLLAKYEPGGRGWYGREVYLSQVAGCFEPYVIWREESEGLTIGITFRPIEELKKVGNRLKKRTRGNHIEPPD